MKHTVVLLADTVCLLVRNNEVKGSLLILRTLIDLFIVRKYVRDLLLYFKIHKVTGLESEDAKRGGGAVRCSGPLQCESTFKERT
jgi:hypothetical protein